MSKFRTFSSPASITFPSLAEHRCPTSHCRLGRYSQNSESQESQVRYLGKAFIPSRSAASRFIFYFSCNKQVFKLASSNSPTIASRLHRETWSRPSSGVSARTGLLDEDDEICGAIPLSAVDCGPFSSTFDLPLFAQVVAWL